jgi:hypothetical protein
MDNYEEQSRFKPYEIPPELSKAAREADALLRPMVQAVEGGYLIQRSIEVLKFQDAHGMASLSAADLLRFMEPLHLVIAMDSAKPIDRPKRDISLTGKTGIILLRFVKLSFVELQKIICKGSKTSLSDNTHAAIIGIAGWIAGHLGIAGNLATALATGMFITVAKATKGGFCKMTPAEIEKALAEAANKPQ